MTPEGKIKLLVKVVLKQYPVYGWWPVPAGYGENSLDYVGCINGKFFAIETKAPGKKLTPRQLEISERIQKAGGKVFVVCDEESLDALEDWLFLDN